MKLQIHPILIFRTPKFSYSAVLEASWNELRDAIKISSQAFYLLIKDTEANEIDELSSKIKFTIWKYFNRAKFRSTPYGTFASFSLLAQNEHKDSGQIVISRHQNIHEFIDWPVKNQIQFEIEDLLKKNVELFSNSSYYLIAGAIRYIACTDGQFELAEIEHDDFVYKILNLCSKPIRLNELMLQLEVEGEDLESVHSLISDMLSLQLLFSDHDANIIGTDYFERIGYTEAQNKTKYIIAERKAISGSLDFNLLSAIPSLVNLLQQLLPIAEQSAVKSFINKFVRKFEQNEVPLIQALDPEIGVGYDELEQAGQSDDFVIQFKKSADVKTVNPEFEQFKKVLKEAQTKNFEKDKVIFLDKMNIQLRREEKKLPNSFSLIMSVVDDLVCVDQLGGVTANALSGRFTMASADVLNYTKEIAEIEKLANPDVLFFDVAYMVESNVDNINRRKLIYDYQLSILNFDTSDSPLLLNDIMVSVHGNEVVLRSKKLNKRLVPKISSAYNYARSDLSAFRLFCDLQHQGLQTNLSISLENLFPDESYYPRFQYKNIVLSQAKWKITSAELFAYIGKDFDLQLCREYLGKLGVSKYFKTGNADQTLTFNQQSELDLQAFVMYMQKQTVSRLEEVMLPAISSIMDDQSEPYLAQFIVSLSHVRQVYKPFSTTDAKSNGVQVKRVFPPGSEWLYFEIFCHQQRSDHLLLTAIPTFLDEHKPEIKSWFFIRYNENGDHIRFRVLLNNAKEGQKLVSSLSVHLDHYLTSGLISDITIKTYKRELDRYGSDLIEVAEKHFCTDSDYVLSLLRTSPNSNDKYKLCSALALSIQNTSLFDQSLFKQVVQTISNSFNVEHQLEAIDFKKLNMQYQLYKAEEMPVLDIEQQEFFNAFSKSFLEILKKCSLERRPKLLGDLFHMHINRLFNKDQRTNEMVFYYFLLKDVQRKIAIGK